MGVGVASGEHMGVGVASGEHMDAIIIFIYLFIFN